MPATTTIVRPVFPMIVLKKAYASAVEADTLTIVGPGWLRLASVASMSGGDAYHVAFRKLKDGSITFGCSCKDWIFRRQHTGECYKHLHLKLKLHLF